MFTNVQIIPAIKQGHLIQWELQHGAPSGVIGIFRSRDGVSWEHLGDVENSYYFIDSTFDPKSGFQVNYKVVYNNEAEYIVTSFLGALPKSDRNIIRTLRRKEILLQEKGGGRPGFLLKRRVDKECSLCDGEPGDMTCPECIGTGFKGGFYKAVPYGVISLNSQLNRKRTTSGVGTYKKDLETTRGLVFPILDEGDVWVEKFTDRRFWITGKTELTYRGIPIIYSQIEMSLIPPRSEVYKIRVGD